MDRREARDILDREIERYRAMSYEELRERVDADAEVFEMMASSGRSYQLELQVFWDHRAGGNVRVMLSIDDGGWRALSPLTTDAQGIGQFRCKSL